MEQNTQNKYLIPLAIVVAGAFVAIAIYFGGSTPQLGSEQVASPTTDIDIASVTTTDHIVGSRSAALVIVEYSDTECPYCKVFHNTMKEIVSTYSGQVAWGYRHFEITNSNDSLDPSELPKIATTIGLNGTAFNACLSSGKYAEFVTKSVEEAVKAGARGTPYSVIVSKNGTKTIINGAEPIEMVKSKIDTLLK